MSNPILGRFHYPTSLRQLVTGRGYNSELVGFLLPYARQDFVYIDDDFLADTLDGNLWHAEADAGSTAFAQGSLENGTVQGVTQNTTGDNIQLHFNTAIFDAARNPGAEIRWKVVTYTAAQLLVEFGFSDPPTDETLPVVTDVDTPAATDNGTTDLVVIHMDGSQTLKTFALVGDGTTPACSKTNFNTAIVPTADTYLRMLVQVRSGGGIGVFNNDPLRQSVEVSTGPDTAILMRPHLLVGTLANTARTVDIDYFRIWSERSPDA